MTDPTPRPDAVPDVLAAIERVRVSLAGGYVLRFIDPGDVAALLAAHDALTADLARLRALFAAGESIDVAGVVARLRAATAYCERDCAKPVSVAGGDVVNACDAIEHLQAECGAARTREELDRTVMGRELAALRESDAAHDAAVAAARAEALREARDAVLARIVDHDGRNESAGVLPSVYARIIVEDCAAAVAALGTKGGGA